MATPNNQRMIKLEPYLNTTIPNPPPRTYPPPIPLLSSPNSARLYTLPQKQNPEWPTTLQCKLTNTNCSTTITTYRQEYFATHRNYHDSLDESRYCNQLFSSPAAYSAHLIEDHNLKDRTVFREHTVCFWPHCRDPGPLRTILKASMYFHALRHAAAVQCPYPNCVEEFRLGQENPKLLREHVAAHANYFIQKGRAGEAYFLPREVELDLVKYAHFRSV